jgi:hypothetical protein
VDSEDVVCLVTLGHLRQSLAFESFLGLDPLLSQGHAKRIAHPHSEAAAPRQSVHHLLDGRLDKVVSHPRGERQDGQLHLARGHSSLVTGLNTAALADLRRRVAFEHLGDGDPSYRLLGASKHLPGFRMLELLTFTEDDQLHAGHHTVSLPDGEGGLASLDLEHVTLDLGEERHDLSHESGDGGGSGTRGRRRLGPGGRDSRKQKESGSDPAGHGAHDTDPRGSGQAMRPKRLRARGNTSPGPAYVRRAS